MPSPPPTSVHHIHPLPLSKISSALVYYYTCPTRHSTLLLSTTTPLLPCRQQQRGPIKSCQNYCYPLLPLPLVDYQYINDNINRHNSPLLCHSISVCYHHWSNVKQRSWCWLLSWWLLPCQNDFIYNCLENSHHYLTFFLSTSYTYSNHHNNPPKNITFYTLFIFHSKEETYTTYFE